jgi:hypothetical protein
MASSCIAHARFRSTRRTTSATRAGSGSAAFSSRQLYGMGTPRQPPTGRAQRRECAGCDHLLAEHGFIRVDETTR